ncbi:MAG: DNA-binding protein [Ignavibacteriaceae bacterium]|jgi:phage regulator Rha-like protein|nr:MAG: ORF6N domain-containing protein [Chlorobiota bacterium]MBE7477687.1 ORF6N domain-containing protein [Ignavibacteriales bacterium]MCC7092822.1 ORF6N domain-containing protein [Ignavibacteriaceae bacterium]MCE7855967.1 ORF6N domain-containing protein [Ignavibacteria bacterium CHB3]MEB2295234.1 ORF6N domain-containing protein [Ignavibacteria bacterium]
MKNRSEKAEIIPSERIERKIYSIRNQKVMLSTHLAALYEVEVKVLNQAVKRNIDRFPRDFMFQLSKKEFENLKSQIVTTSWGGARRSQPYAFTEQGVAMLSSVLKSKKAIKVNIQIMRAFVKLREIISTHKELAQKLKELELKIDSHDTQIQAIFDVINQLIIPPDPTKRKMGFTINE